MSILNNKWARAAIPALSIHCSIGTVYCWSSFSTALSDRIGVSSSITGWAFSLAIFFLGMSAAFAGKFVEKDIHKSSLVATICFTVGMVGTGLCVQFTKFLGPVLSVIGIFIFYGFIMGIGLGVGYLTPVKTLMLWFKDNKGLGTGISIMGFGLAKAISSPLMNHLQLTVGLYNMFYILAIIYFVMLMAGHFLLKKPDGWVEKSETQIPNSLVLFKNKTFLGTWIMFYINITCGLALISFEKQILQVLGIGLVSVSIIQSITAGSNALGRIGFSTISDFMKDRNTVYKIIFILSITVSIIPFFIYHSPEVTPVVVVIAFIVINAGYGGGFSTLPALLESRFGMKNISQIHGLALSAWAFAGLTGNQITAGILNATNSYQMVFLVLAILYLVAFIISITLISKDKQEIK